MKTAAIVSILSNEPMIDNMMKSGLCPYLIGESVHFHFRQKMLLLPRKENDDQCPSPACVSRFLQRGLAQLFELGVEGIAFCLRLSRFDVVELK